MWGLLSKSRETELTAQVAKLTEEVEGLRIIRQKSVKDNCAILLIGLNNVAFDADPAIRERIRNFTMIASRTIELLYAMNRYKLLYKLQDEYIPQIAEAVAYSSQVSRTDVLDAINAVENILLECIRNSIDYKRIDALATLKAMTTCIKTTPTTMLQEG